MKLFDNNEAPQCAAALLDWFAHAMRPLPWRTTYHPYEVWISEIMLQQTQMERGVRYFQNWMEHFPDIAAVAAASEEDILHAWEGLGYYRRARFIQKAANIIMEQYGGKLPDTPEALGSLPGLGDYTVAAILSIAFNQDVLCIDANVERVFARLLNLEESPRTTAMTEIIREQGMLMLPRGRARLYNQALMELGALICGKNPKCSFCPIKSFCESRRLGLEHERPVPEQKPERIAVLAVHAILMNKENVFLVKRATDGLWGGLWEFPGTEYTAETSSEKAVQDMLREKFGVRASGMKCVGTVRHNYTKHKLRATFYELTCPDDCWQRLSEQESGMIVNRSELSTLAMPAHHRKMAGRYAEKNIPPEAKQLSLI